MQLKDWQKKFIQQLELNVSIHLDECSALIEKDLTSWRKSHYRCQLSDFLSLAETLKVTPEDLWDLKIPWAILRERKKTDSSALPEEWLQAGGTHASSLRAVLSFLTQKFNPETSDSIQMKMGLKSDWLVSDTVKFSLRCTNILFKTIQNHLQFSLKDYEHLATYLHLHTKRTEILKLAKAQYRPEKILKMMVDHASQYEMNYQYSFQQTGQIIKINSRPTEALRDCFKDQSPLTPEVSAFKLKTFQTMTCFTHGQLLRLVEETDLKNTEVNYIYRINSQIQPQVHHLS
jgi:hypothetical protein